MSDSAGTSGEPPNFRARILTSAKLAGLRFASDIGLRLFSTIVLTRLLAPEIYGVFAIVLVYMYLLEMFSDLGLRSLVVTKEGDVEDRFLWTCWTVSILRGVLIAAISCLIAVVIGLLQGNGVFAEDSPYAAPNLPWAIASLGAATLIMGAQSPVQYVHEREMRFGRVTAAYVAVNVIGLVATVLLAIHLRSIWALVIGNVIRTLALVSLSFLLFRGPQMRLHMNRPHLDIVIGRGKWIIGHSILTALSQSADRLVLGFVMTSSTFGFYFIARQLIDMLTRFLTTLNGQMGLQVFTHIQKSTTEDFRRNYYRYRLFFDCVAGLGAGGLLILAPQLVDLVFDDRYRGVAAMVQFLAVGIVLTGPLVLRDAFSAERRFRLMTITGLASTATLWIGLAIAVFIFGSITISLLVIALHRLPEALMLTIMGTKRNWIVIWREAIPLGFMLLGALAGWGVAQVWAGFT